MVALGSPEGVKTFEDAAEALLKIPAKDHPRLVSATPHAASAADDPGRARPVRTAAVHPRQPGRRSCALLQINHQPAVEFLDAHRIHYLRQSFQREPDFGVTSVNYGLAELLAQSKTPS
jgi:hypothetical protein